MSVFVLFISIVQASLAGPIWDRPVEVGEYTSMEECQKAADGATKRVGGSDSRKGWTQFNDGVICIERLRR